MKVGLIAKKATQSTPIVFVVSQDPVSLGLVASLARPGGNVTGINFFSGELVGKQLGLLRELVPAASRIAVIVNPANTTSAERTVKDVTAAFPAIGDLHIKTFTASTSGDIEIAFLTLVRERYDALLLASDPFFSSLPAIPSLAVGASNWSASRPGTQSPRSIRSATSLKLAD
jgi:putative ABC transport system substrate-binding protein